MAVSRKDWATLEESRSHRLTKLTAEQTNGLIETLQPINSVKSGNLGIESVDYILSFQAGKSPVTIQIRLGNSLITYGERQFQYEGGNAVAFKEAIRKIQEGRDMGSGKAPAKAVRE